MERFLTEEDGPRVFCQASTGPTGDQPSNTTKLLKALVMPRAIVKPMADPVELRPASDNESVGSSNPSSPSVFTGQLSRSSTITSLSSDPAELPDPLNEQFEIMSVGGPNYELPCIFRGINNCPIFFQGDKFEIWHSHTVSHFGDAGPPNRAFCIFCSRFFNSSNPKSCWRALMLHIAEHFENRWDIENSRPDFPLLKYLFAKGCISEEHFTACMKFTERPALEGLRPHDYVPEETIAKIEAQQEKANRVPIIESRHEMRERQRRRRPDLGSK